MYGNGLCQTFCHILFILFFFLAYCFFFFSEINSLYLFGFNMYTVFAGKQLVSPVIFFNKSSKKY